MATPQDLLIALSRAHALTEIRSSGDPELGEALEDVRETQESLGWLVVRVGSQAFEVHSEAVPDDFGVLGKFRDVVLAAGIREIRLQDVLEPELLEEFLRRLHPSFASGEGLPSQRFRGLETDIGLSFGRARGPLPGMSGSIRELFGADDEGSAAEDESAEDLPVEEYPTKVAEAEGVSLPTGAGEPPSHPGVQPEPDEPQGTSPTLPPELEELLQVFLDPPGGDRAGPAEALRSAAEGLKAAREMGTLCDLVELLSEAATAAPEHPEVLELALELTRPAVASQIGARLGQARQDEDRGRLIRVAAALGREMALALADALGEARDRYQRRSYMDAMIALGATGLEVAEAMVQDPRWFVVRNGVSLLGEIGGEDAVAHLTTTLANSDPRVRKETVQALAKLGGEDAAMLLLGMLDDPEAEVRAVACRAAGILKVEKSYKPLMRLLEEDQDEDVQVESLQALGQLGDPGAVPLIEKRAVGGLFSKPNREIRIAAYRALAGIGTPHAKELLQKAAKDSDSGIRTVVQALLDAR